MTKLKKTINGKLKEYVDGFGKYPDNIIIDKNYYDELKDYEVIRPFKIHLSEQPGVIVLF